MKFILSALFLLPALAAENSPAGRFVFPHEIAFPGYGEKSACEAEEGRWREEVCWFDAEDEVNLQQDGDSWRMEISTLGTNAHECYFSGAATRENPQTFRSSRPSEVWREGKIVPSVCVVTLRFLDPDSVSLIHNGECASFCGMRAGLTIRLAHRAR